MLRALGIVAALLGMAVLTADASVAQRRGRRGKPPTARQMEQAVSAAFDALDKNKDGALSPDEFRKGFPDNTRKQTDAEFKIRDVDGDGKLIKDEFKKGTAAAKSKAGEKNKGDAKKKNG